MQLRLKLESFGTRGAKRNLKSRHVLNAVRPYAVKKATLLPCVIFDLVILETFARTNRNWLTVRRYESCL